MENEKRIKMNEFKVKKGLIVTGSGSTIFDVQGSQGQLFSVTDSLIGELFSVNDISGIPIFTVNSDDTINMGTYGAEAIKINGSTTTISNLVITGTGVVTNLNADLLDGNHASYFINTSNIGSQSVSYATSAGNADTVDGEHSSVFALHRGEGRNYIDYSRYVYNNGAYSGTGWIEPSDLGVRYASSAGNASTSTTLQTTRTINGTNFNGSSSIETSYWGATRTITIGNTIRSVNGSGNLSWSLSEIGAPSTTGVGASGNWGISISGNASKLDPLSGDGNYKLAYTADGARTNSGEWGRAVMYYVPNGQTYGIRVDRADYSDSTGSANVASGANGDFYVDDNYGNTIVGLYNASRLQGVFAMGNAYKLSADGTSASNHYGIAWSHPNAGGTASNLTDHGVLIQVAGQTKVALSSSIWCVGDIIAYSDARVKTNIQIIDNPLDRIKKVRGVTFTRTDFEDKEKRYAGVIAQEMIEALPEVVTENADGELSVSYGNVVSLLIESIKEQQKQIEELKELVNQHIQNNSK